MAPRYNARVKRFLRILVLTAPLGASAALFFACGSSQSNNTIPAFNGCTPTDPTPPLDGAFGGRCNCNDKVVETKVGGTCNVVTRQHPYEGGEHHEPGSNIVYCSKPPNSGPHFNIWAAYQSYSTPVPSGFLVHSMEHGGVVVYYKCASRDACPEVASKLQAILDARPVDNSCAAPVKHRLILAPDPTLDTAVAAAAHTFTYHADCVDQTSLAAFIDAHYAHGTEDLCANGIDPTFDAGPVDSGDAAPSADAADAAKDGGAG